MAIGWSGVGAWSGLRARKPTPCSCSQRASARTSARSPIPQLERERAVGTCRDHAPRAQVVGQVAATRADEQRRDGPPVDGREVVEAPREVGRQRRHRAEVGAAFQREPAGTEERLGARPIAPPTPARPRRGRP